MIKGVRTNEMVNNLCVQCSGRGFMWIKSSWRSSPSRTSYVQGPMCKRCKGSGKEPSRINTGCVTAAGVIISLTLLALWLLT